MKSQGKIKAILPTAFRGHRARSRSAGEGHWVPPWGPPASTAQGRSDEKRGDQKDFI